MKKFFALFITLACAAAVHAQQDPQPVEDISKVIQFKETDHDFGKIPYGKPAEFKLDMKNVSFQIL